MDFVIDAIIGAIRRVEGLERRGVYFENVKKGMVEGNLLVLFLEAFPERRNGTVTDVELNFVIQLVSKSRYEKAKFMLPLCQALETIGSEKGYLAGLDIHSSIVDDFLNVFVEYNISMQELDESEKMEFFDIVERVVDRGEIESRYSKHRDENFFPEEVL